MPEVVEFTILDETEYTDRTQPARPFPAIMVTFQLPDGRVSSVSIPKEKYTKEYRNKVIAEQVKKMVVKPPEVVRMPI